jgi:pilus assembly protein CpaB
MNVRAIIPLVAGLAIAGVAGKMGLDYVRKAQGGQVKAVQVWAAVADIPRGTAIQETMLKPIPFPQQALPPGAIVEKSKLIGRVPLLVAPANLPVLETMLAAPGTAPGIIVPPGFRAVAVKIDESSGVDNHLQPGVSVDVLAFSRNRGGGKTTARTIIENVRVAAVGERVSVGGTIAPSAGAADKAKSKTSDKPPRAVTLFVKPEDAPRLHLAEQEGRIKLSMRGIEDVSLAQGDSTVTSDDVLGNVAGKKNPTGAATSDWMTRMMDRLLGREPAQDDPNAAPVVALAPARVTPRAAWVMAIVNGTERKQLGWSEMNSIEPIEMTEHAPGGLFKDDSVQSVEDHTTPPRSSGEEPPGIPEPDEESA